MQDVHGKEEDAGCHKGECRGKDVLSLGTVAAQAEGSVAGEDVIGAGDSGDGEEGAEFEDDDAEDGRDDDEDVSVDEDAAGAYVQAAALAAEDREQASGERYSSTEDVEQDVGDMHGGVAVEHADHDACVLREKGKDF